MALTTLSDVARPYKGVWGWGGGGGGGGMKGSGESSTSDLLRRDEYVSSQIRLTSSSRCAVFRATPFD